MTTSKDDIIAVLEDRVAELEELLGIDVASIEPYRMLGLRPVSRKMLGYIMKRELATRSGLFAAAYGHLPECDQPQQEKEAIGVRIYEIRNCLASHGLKIKTHFGVGYSISPDDKRKLIAVIAQLQEREPVIVRKQTKEFRRYGQ